MLVGAILPHIVQVGMHGQGTYVVQKLLEAAAPQELLEMSRVRGGMG